MNPVPHSTAVSRSIKLPLFLSLMYQILQRKLLDFKALTAYTNQACALDLFSAAAEAGHRTGSRSTNNLLLVMPNQNGDRKSGQASPSRRTEKALQ